MPQQQREGQPIHLIVEPGSALYAHLMRYFDKDRQIVVPDRPVSEVLDEESHIDALGLPTRTRNALVRYGIYTTGTLAAQTPESLAGGIPGFGRVSLKQTIEALDKFGLKLADKPVRVMDYRIPLRNLHIRGDLLESLEGADIHTVQELLNAKAQWGSVSSGHLWWSICDLLRRHHIEWRY